MRVKISALFLILLAVMAQAQPADTSKYDYNKELVLYRRVAGLGKGTGTGLDLLELQNPYQANPRFDKDDMFIGVDNFVRGGVTAVCPENSVCYDLLSPVVDLFDVVLYGILKFLLIVAIGLFVKFVIKSIYKIVRFIKQSF